MTADLPSDEDIATMFHGGETGYWVCYIYPVAGLNKVIKVWNRTMDRTPLAKQYGPIGCVEVQLG